MGKPVIDEAFVAEVWNGNAERWANAARDHDWLARWREQAPLVLMVAAVKV